MTPERIKEIFISYGSPTYRGPNGIHFGYEVKLEHLGQIAQAIISEELATLKVIKQAEREAGRREGREEKQAEIDELTHAALC